MPSVVKRRPDQIVHRGVDDDEALGDALFDMDDSGDEQSRRAGERSPGLKSHRDAERAESPAHQTRITL